MVSSNKDYFVDCDFVSLSALRAIYGVWVNVCVAVVAICIRYIFRHRIKRTLLSGRHRINLWRVSPAVTIPDVFELRHVLTRALAHGQFFFVFASLFCVVTSLMGAASTVISNYTVVTNPVIHNVAVHGRNVTHFHNSIGGAKLEMTSRVKALDLANAPLEELFDFAPNDDVYWLYEASQWNNTWKGSCTFTKHDAVELIVYPTNSTRYQTEVPLLGNYIPSWATVNETKQGVSYSGFYSAEDDGNATGSWKNTIVTYFFGLSPDNDVTFPAKTANISIVNYLAHEIGKDPATAGKNLVNGGFMQTAFRSDVHVAECDFVNTLENGTTFQANAAGGSYSNAASNVAQMYTRAVVMNSTDDLPVIQPTGMQMVRYWQAFMSVKDSQYPYPDVRTLAVVQDTVQIRLSSLVITVGAFVFALIAACVANYQAVKYKTHEIQLPSSQLDWMVQAAREHAKTNHGPRTTRRRTKSPNDFAMYNQDNFFILSPHLDPCIAISSDLAESEMDARLSLSVETPSEVDFDPWGDYSESHLKLSPMS